MLSSPFHLSAVRWHNSGPDLGVVGVRMVAGNVQFVALLTRLVGNKVGPVATAPGHAKSGVDSIAPPSFRSTDDDKLVLANRVPMGDSIPW